MPSLSSIPEELLDKIIEIVILTERIPPADVVAAEKDRTSGSSDNCRSWLYGPKHVRFKKTETAANATALLLTNKLLHRQTASALRRLYANGLTYKLDCIFLNEQEILPTWTHVPAVSRRVGHIDVTFRIFGTNKGRSAFRGGDGSPPQIVWTFYYLLEHFLEHGPASSSKNCMAVDSIKLDFYAGEPDQPTYDDTSEGHRAWRDRTLGRHGAPPENTGTALLMRPKCLAEYVASELQHIVSTRYHTAEFATIIFERVGSFSVCSEGENILGHDENIWGLDVGQKLARASHHPDRGHECYSTSTFGNLPGVCRIPTFWNWKYRAVQLRKQRNLPIKEDAVVWPTLEEMQRWRAGAEKERETAGYGLKCSRCMCRHRDLEKMLMDRSNNS